MKPKVYYIILQKLTKKHPSWSKDQLHTVAYRLYKGVRKMNREIDISKLKKGDTVYVKCKVEAVFPNGGMVMVSTRDCDNGFDAYVDEIVEVENKEVEK